MSSSLSHGRNRYTTKLSIDFVVLVSITPSKNLDFVIKSRSAIGPRLSREAANNCLPFPPALPTLAYYCRLNFYRKQELEGEK
jgi:hypothetical protein